MQNRPFIDPTIPPTSETLAKTFGKANEFYQKLDELTSHFKKEWNFSKSSGWAMKVHDKKKALYYLIPLNESFIISLTVREQEKIKFLEEVDLAAFHEPLRQAKKYSEGYAMQFPIQNKTDWDRVEVFLGKLMEMR